jgi:hypothetical protein
MIEHRIWSDATTEVDVSVLVPGAEFEPLARFEILMT